MSAEEAVSRIRGEMRARRASLRMEEQLQAARAVCALVRKARVYRRARTVMAYAAVRGEVSVDGLMMSALRGGKTLLLPRCGAEGRMTARRVRTLEELVPGAFGIPEPPEAAQALAPGQIDLILVPGIAFGRNGERVGQGGGFYDRFLPESRAFRLGVCHAFALQESLVQRAHDARMDAVVTPQGIIDCRG